MKPQVLATEWTFSRTCKFSSRAIKCFFLDTRSKTLLILLTYKPSILYISISLKIHQTWLLQILLQFPHKSFLRYHISLSLQLTLMPISSDPSTEPSDSSSVPITSSILSQPTLVYLAIVLRKSKCSIVTLHPVYNFLFIIVYLLPTMPLFLLFLLLPYLKQYKKLYLI